MKNFILSAALCCVVALASAQDFGKTLLSGSISYNSTSSETAANNQNKLSRSAYTVQPKIGWFLNQRVAMGLLMSYGKDVEETYVSSTSGYYQTQVEKTSRLFSVGPFLRIYKSVGSKAAFFGQGSAVFNYKEQVADFQSTATGRGVSFALGPGFVFFPSAIVGIEATLGNFGYSHLYTKKDGSEGGDSNSGFQLGVGFATASLGVSFYLGRSAGE